MSEQSDAILAGIDTLEIARIKGGFWKLAVTLLLAQKGRRGIDWHANHIFTDIETAIKSVQGDKATKLAIVGIEAHIQDALAEFRAEAKELLDTYPHVD